MIVYNMDDRINYDEIFSIVGLKDNIKSTYEI